MTIEQAWFVLEHGSAEGLKVYLEAIKTIKKNCVEIVRCEDCKFRFDLHCPLDVDHKQDPDWFCADGKRAVKWDG